MSLSHNHENLHFVDLRGIIDPSRDWVNEFHLRNSGYASVAAFINEVIQSS